MCAAQTILSSNMSSNRRSLSDLARANKLGHVPEICNSLAASQRILLSFLDSSLDQKSGFAMSS